MSDEEFDNDDTPSSEAPEDFGHYFGGSFPTLGEHLRFSRKRKGIPRTTFAKFANISPNSLVRYEKAGEPDGQYPPILKLVKICELLELDPRDVFDSVASSSDYAPEELCFEFSEFHGDKNQSHVTPRRSDNNDFDVLLNEIKKIQEQLSALTTTSTENGPDHEGPSRRSQNPSTAVDAALTRPKEEDQT